MHFSVAPQTVTDPVTGHSIRFEVDPDDSSIVRMCAYVAGEGSQDYLRATFSRNGLVRDVVMVDAEAEEEARLRKEAEARVALAPVTEEDRKAAEDAVAKQAADDKALLASEPKASKYEAKAKTDKEPADKESHKTKEKKKEPAY